MLRELELRQLTFGAIFKITFWVGISFWFVMSLIILLFGLIDPSILTFNDRAAETAVEVLLGIPMIWIVGVIFSAIVSALGVLAFFLLRKIIPVGKFSYRDKEIEGQN